MLVLSILYFLQIFFGLFGFFFSPVWLKILWKAAVFATGFPTGFLSAVIPSLWSRIVHMAL